MPKTYLGTNALDDPDLAASQVTSGTFDDARIPAGVTRDTELDTVESDLASAIADGDASTLTSAQAYAVPKATLDANSVLYATTDDTPAALAIAANKFPARSSAGNIAAKDITDFALSLLDDADAPAARTTLGAAPAAFVGCSLTKSADQSGNVTATNTPVTFDGESYDTNSFHDNSTNPSRITIPAGMGGKYLFIGSVAIVQPAVKVELMAQFGINGTADVRTRVRTWNSEVSTENPQLRTTAILNLSAGDYVELLGYHEHGSNRDFQGATAVFQCTLLGT